MADETSGQNNPNPGRPRPGGKLLRRSAGVLTLAGLLAAIGFAGGFVWFANKATNMPAPYETVTADGIVVFTGGSDRIEVAARLLAQGKGRRLLISGVNPVTSRRDLEAISPEMEQLSRCCIDLGREAENTIGNAQETADWARNNGFRSLLVVTSIYHMPRSLTELTSAMPEAALVANPVASTRLQRPWWRDSGVTRLLMSEYTKYLVAMARLAVIPGARLANRHG